MSDPYGNQSWGTPEGGGGQPYGQYPPAPHGGYPPAQQNQGTNGFAIAGFICAFLCGILGLIFSIVGLNQINSRGGGGKGLAIAGIVIAGLNILAGIVIAVGR